MKPLAIAGLLCAVLLPHVVHATSLATFWQANANSPPHTNAAPEPGNQQTIRVTEMPSVNLSKDWSDYSYWIFALFLAVVGGFQSVLLWGNLREIQRQVTQMERQTSILEKSVELAEKSADAAKQNIDLFISRERAHLRIELLSLDWPPPPGSTTVRYRVTHYGATEAYITS